MMTNVANMESLMQAFDAPNAGQKSRGIKTIKEGGHGGSTDAKVDEILDYDYGHF